MAKYFKIVSYCIIVFLFASCANKTKKNIGDSIIKEIQLEFNEESIEHNDWLEFKVNFDSELVVDFSKGTLDNNVFKITAKEYMIDEDPVILTISSNQAGQYKFKLEYLKCSEECEVEFSNKKDISFPELVFAEKWKGLIIPSIIIIIVLILAYILYKRSITFTKGSIHIIEPVSANYLLKGKTKFDSFEENCCKETQIRFVLKKVRGGKARIANKSEDTILYINNKIESTSKAFGKNYEVKLVKENQEIIFKYL